MDFNGFVESAAFSGAGFTKFYVPPNEEIECRLAELDPATRKEVNKHLDDFHSREEMEIYINHLKNGSIDRIT